MSRRRTFLPPLRLPGLLFALALVAASGAGLPARAAEVPAPVAIVDPAVPGESLPSHGRSLFDQLFAVSRGGQAEIDLPFPFAALLARIEAQLQRDPASPLPAAKRVLIPLGRSLQRPAAAPDYFAYPRVVVAVDSPPVAGALLLKDRLYIGYQEQSAVLEVISYNEAAGRFEFQLVKDYRSGGTPRVVYANRNICFACHQNGSPIFSRALWDETNANPGVSALLLASGQHFHGVAAERGVDVPYAIDLATERANGFASTQRLWREGCGGSDAVAQRCRAGLFTAALRHALSGGQPWKPDVGFEQAVAAPLRAEARRLWPGGLAAGNPDIPNRNPLQGVAKWPADTAARVALSNVPARFDPLLPRPMREIWRADAPDALRQLIAGLAEFVAAPDRLRLDRALARAPSPRAALRLQAPCRIDDLAAASRWSLRCPGPDGMLLAGTLTTQAGRPTGGRLSRLALPGGTALNGLDLSLDGKATSSAVTLLPRVGDHPARTAEGNVIGAIEIRRTSAGAGQGGAAKGVEGGEGAESGEARVEIRQDFASVQQAVERLADGPEAANLFGPAPFPREKLFAALFAELGAPAPTPCCQAASALPSPQLEIPAVAPGHAPGAGSGDPTLASFQPYCAACHQTAEEFPPNFLQGSPAEVSTRLRHCAPRLYVRLAMAGVARAQRAKTPMPPESMLPAFATDAAAWSGSPVRAALLAQVEQWLRAETGQAPRLETMLAAGYEALRPCLPPR